MTDLRRGTHSNQDSSSDTEPKRSFKTTLEKKSAGINAATPDDWDLLRRKHPAIDLQENVFRPPHYLKEGGVECIDVMIQLYGSERVREWAEITAFKYQWRQGNKEGNSPEQDKMKSIWYTRFSMGDDPRDD